MSRRDHTDLRVRRRLAEISDRLDELRARSQEMSELPASPQSERDRLARAAHRASQARAHAAEAARLATMAYRHSAQVHDQVADLYDELASAGTGDVARYQRQADRHRTLAAGDRTAARRETAA